MCEGGRVPEIPAGICRSSKNEPYEYTKNGRVWKFNPNSEYNKMNMRQDADMKAQEMYYSDQRQFYLHRKILAENIEKARRADPEKEA